MTVKASLEEAKELSNWLWDGMHSFTVDGGYGRGCAVDPF